MSLKKMGILDCVNAKYFPYSNSGLNACCTYLGLDVTVALPEDGDMPVLSQEQILYFVENNKDRLIDNYYANLFFFKVKDEFFVAHVNVYSGGNLHARVYRFPYDFVWYAEYRFRFVVPQLALAS